MKRQLNTYRILSFEQALRETNNGKEFLNIGPTPYNENCTQAGMNLSDGIFECTVYIRQLIRTYGTPQEGCEFFIIHNVHEFGSYYDVNIFYNIPLQEEEKYPGPSPTSILQWSEQEKLLQQNEALKTQSSLDYWDDEAIRELIEGGHHLHVTPVIKMNKSA